MMDGIRADLGGARGLASTCSPASARWSQRGEVDQVVERLRAQGLVYEGVLEPPKGKTPDDWEPREQTLFRATQFGDDVDRPLRKSDGVEHLFHQRHRQPLRTRCSAAPS